jgi:hypothetical protein
MGLFGRACKHTTHYQQQHTSQAADLVAKNIMEIGKLVRLRCPNKLTKVAAGTAHSWKKSYMNLSHDPMNLRINTCGNSSLILRIFSALLNFHFISFNFPEMVKCSLNDSNDLAQHAASSLFQCPSEKKSNLAYFYNT